MNMIVDVYRCGKREGLYLFVEKDTVVSELSSSLLNSLGVLEHAMTLSIDEEKKLARSDPKKVISAITEQGFYLQMPPSLPSTNT